MALAIAVSYAQLSHMAGAVDDSTINIVVVIIIIIIIMEKRWLVKRDFTTRSIILEIRERLEIGR